MNSQNVSTGRLIFGSLLVSLLILVHVNFLLQGQYVGLLFILAFASIFYLSKQKVTKIAVKYFQYRTAAILSFLLPVSAIIFSFVYTASQIATSTGSEASKAGGAIGSAIGSTFVVIISFIAGLSLGIVFYLMSKKSK